MQGRGDAAQPGDALVLLALDFPELAVDVAQLSPARQVGQGQRVCCLWLRVNAFSACSSLPFPWILLRLQSAHCMTAGEGVSRRFAGCLATSCCLRAGEAGGRAGQDAVTAAAGEQGGQAGFQALAAGTQGAEGAARPWLPAGICCWGPETAPKCCSVLTQASPCILICDAATALGARTPSPLRPPAPLGCLVLPGAQGQAKEGML